MGGELRHISLLPASNLHSSLPLRLTITVFRNYSEEVSDAAYFASDRTCRVLTMSARRMFLRSSSIADVFSCDTPPLRHHRLSVTSRVTARNVNMPTRTVVSARAAPAAATALRTQIIRASLQQSVGSRPSDHYFRCVCLSVCLCSFSQPSLIRFRSN